MQYWRSAVVTILVLIVVIFSTSCGGGHHSNTVGPITTINLTPSPTVSLNAGDVIQMTANATDAQGHAVLNQPFTFSSDNAAIDISNPSINVASLCAGKWDSLSKPVVCTPATAAQLANIKVTAQGVTSNSVAVSVHLKVARVVVTAGSASCVSQGGTISYTAQAFDSNGNDITSSVGTFGWSIADSSIGTLANTSTAPGTPNTVTAALPGSTTVTAVVNNITNPVISVAAVFQECPVASITISGPNTNPNLAFNPSPGGIGTTGQLTAVVKDTLGATVNNVALSWNSSLPSAASVNSSGLVTGVAFGTSNITASCAANSACNKNQASVVTSNTVTANVGPGSTLTTVYATGKATTTLLPIDSSTNTAGTAVTLPDKPNSLVFDPTGANAYLGSDSGLIVVNAATNAVTKTVGGAPGQVLAVSPNGQFVLVGGKLSNNNFVSTVVFNNNSNTVVALPINAAVAGDFSPDGSEAVIVNLNTPATPATSTSTVFAALGTAVRTVATLAAPGATDVSFLPNGALAYIANSTTPLVRVCNSTSQAGSSSLSTSKIKGIADPTDPTLPNKMLGTNSPNIAVMTPTLTAACPPGITETRNTVGFGSAFTANQIIVTPDSKHAYVPAGDVAGKLLSYDVVANTTGSVTLTSGTAVTTTGGATLDGASVYVGVSDTGGTVGSVHRIDVNAGTDATQISVSFIPDLVAVRPH